ncbi:MAG: hypothetical protein JWR32_1362 [Mycobacterium sp.]|jgi:hypothetical protein|nr:hypothetical protein [Mycobacterium sp.]
MDGLATTLGVSSATISTWHSRCTRNGQQPFKEYGDEDRFEIMAGGVLKIFRQDGTNHDINPALWASGGESEHTPSCCGR